MTEYLSEEVLRLAHVTVMGSLQLLPPTEMFQKHIHSCTDIGDDNANVDD